MPSRDARSLITVLPEQLQSPLLTAEWEYRLGEIERGELSPEEFLSGIYALPSLAADLFGNVQHFEAFMEALKRSAPVPLAFEEMDADTDGYFSSSQQRIAIRQGMSEVQTVSAAVHEIATQRRLKPPFLPLSSA